MNIIRANGRVALDDEDFTVVEADPRGNVWDF